MKKLRAIIAIEENTVHSFEHHSFQVISEKEPVSDFRHGWYPWAHLAQKYAA
jgi:hypothetical protein